MTAQSSREIFIQSAAAARGENIFTLPTSLQIPADPRSPDPLTDLALRLAESLLLTLPEPARPHIGLFLGTTLGCFAADQEFDRSRRTDNALFASPAAFARTLPSTLASELSVKLGIRGPVLTICAGGHSAATALRRAISWMYHLNLDFCLAGAADLEDGKPVAALLLLSLRPSNSIGTLSAGTLIPAALETPVDASLLSLMDWIRNPAPLTLASNLVLTPVPAADQ